MSDTAEQLLKAFHVGPEDIEANRAGKLTERQAKLLAASGMRQIIGAIVIGVILAVILAFVANKPLKAVQVIVAAILFLAVLAVGITDYLKTRAAGAEGRVELFAGPVQVQSRGKSGFYIHVAGRSFKLGIHPWKIQNGAAYRVYVAPRANRIVAIEPE